MFGKKPIDWCNKGNKLIGKKKFEEALECFERAYGESEKVKKKEERLQVRVVALEGMGKVHSYCGRFEDSVGYFDRGLGLLLVEKGIESDPLATGVSEEVRWNAVSDPRVYLFYAHKAMALRNLAIAKEENSSGEHVQEARRIIDELLKAIPMTVPHMEISRQLAGVRYDLVVWLARCSCPDEFFETEDGEAVFSVDAVESAYRELGYTEAQIVGDFEIMGIARAGRGRDSKHQ
jgi:tetratricopeptide (TPR) repeat protein